MNIQKTLINTVFKMIVLIGLIFMFSTCEDKKIYDIALINGQVMDPESGLNAVRNVGILNGKIDAITTDPLNANELIDVSGFVVAPGFIDLNGYDFGSPEDCKTNRELQVKDGVTTSLELEAGVVDVDAWYKERENISIMNYGISVGHSFARIQVFGGFDLAPTQIANPDQMNEIISIIEKGLNEGALGIGYGIQYFPGSSREEIYRIFKLSAEMGVPNFVHVRSSGVVEPGSSIEAIQEMIANAATTDASVHIVHIGSSGLGQVSTILEMIDAAQKNGLDITTDVYPYSAAATHIGAAIFDPGWRKNFNADFNDLEWAGTGERLTEQTFNHYRKTEPHSLIVAHIIPENMVEAAVAHPIVMIESDAVPIQDAPGHPRGAGTFARVLGFYVREKGILSLMDALRKMTLLPAQRLENVAPQMKNKGRIKVGADADITVFNPEKIIDKATYANPNQSSEGILHVIVNGIFVVKASELIQTYPGQPIRRRIINIPQN